MASLLVVGLCSGSELLWSAGLEADDGGLLSYGQTGQWEWGVVTSGPEGSFDGTACWATQLGGWYLNDAIDHLEVPDLPLDATDRPVLGLQHWYSFQAGDQGTIELFHGGVWEQVEPIYGYPEAQGYAGASGAWQQAWVDLDGLVQGDAVRLTFHSNNAGADNGWYLDQLELWDGDPVPPQIELEGCLEDTEVQDGYYPVEVTARDDLGVTSVVLEYSVDAQPVRRRVLTTDGDGLYQGGIPGQPIGSSVSYIVEASDGENVSAVPTEPCSFVVRLAAPTQLQGPVGVFWGTAAPLS